jgi:Domain of unknown function (DUF4382)
MLRSFGSTPMPRQTRLRFLLLCGASLLLCFLLIGCGDTCFVITGIFPNATSTTNPPTCNLGAGNGTITVGINSVRPSPVAPMSPNLQHVFITLRGIEANPNSVAAEDSPDWQELAPEFATEPVQIDLMATPASGVSCASRLTRKSIVRASVYRQLRLRLVPDQSVAGEPQPKHNECSGSGFNCVVDTNGHAHALALKNGAHDFLITSNRITEGSFNVLPDTETNLSIVFDPYSSLAAANADAVQIMPVFSAETAVACDSSPSLP